jgi:UDP-N-acetylglucosamine transferase subunit ALG13
MIFVTIGTQLPFDRLIKIIDELAPQLNEEVVAQVHQCGFIPKNIKTIDFLAPDEFDKLFDQARFVVSHAGMGTILSALKKGKSLIVFPRIAALGEHRNEHQLATARIFKEMGIVNVAMNEDELRGLLLCNDLHPPQRIPNKASASLIQSIESFIDGQNDYSL